MSTVFSSVPLVCVGIAVQQWNGVANDVDTVKLASRTALSWAENVLTLKHIIVAVYFGSFAPYPDHIHGVEVQQNSLDATRLRSIPEEEAQRLRRLYSALDSQVYKI